MRRTTDSRVPALVGLAAVAALTFTSAACGSDDDEPVATDAPPATDAPVATDAPAGTDAPPATEAPVETDAPTETDPPPATEAPVETDAPAATDASVETEPPVAEPRSVIDATTVSVLQFHMTEALPEELLEAGAFSSIIIEDPDLEDGCTYRVILDNDPRGLDPNDVVQDFGVTENEDPPSVEIGIDREGRYYVVRVCPGVPDLPLGTPLTDLTVTDGTMTVGDGEYQLLSLDGAPAVYTVDFGEDLMQPAAG